MSNDNFDPLEYLNAPGHRGVDTSVAAAIDLAPKLGRLQVMVLEAIRAAKEKGPTADEVCDAVSFDRWSIQPRRSALRAKGQICDSGMRRQNKTGKSAIVSIAREFAADRVAA